MKKPEYTFTERGLPTLAKKWRGELPELPDSGTAIGRRVKGELEQILDYACKRWLVSVADPGHPDLCTAEWLAVECTAIDGRPTSTGAIARILHKWNDIDYAIISEKPLRFIGLSANGMEKGLEEINRRRKQKAKHHYNWDKKEARK